MDNQKNNEDTGMTDADQINSSSLAQNQNSTSAEQNIDMKDDDAGSIKNPQTHQDQPMKSSLDDDAEDAQIASNQDSMINQSSLQAQQASQIKSVSVGQSFESSPLQSSQNQTTGSNAPIEIRKKEEVPLEANQSEESTQNSKKNDTDAMNNQRDFLKKVAQKIFHQIKNGCNKDLCLNIHCRTNAYGKWFF